MPLTAKGSEILAKLQSEYGAKKGESVLYAGQNKGTFTGIDRANALSKAADAIVQLARDGRRLTERMDAVSYGVHHIATITAFANKFGTYTAVISSESNGSKITERFQTYDEAKNFCRSKAWDMFGPGRYASMPRGKDEYLANYWV
jgi:hypothetical protein